MLPVYLFPLLSRPQVGERPRRCPPFAALHSHLHPPHDCYSFRCLLLSFFLIHKVTGLSERINRLVIIEGAHDHVRLEQIARSSSPCVPRGPGSFPALCAPFRSLLDHHLPAGLTSPFLVLCTWWGVVAETPGPGGGCPSLLSLQPCPGARPPSMCIASRGYYRLLPSPRQSMTWPAVTSCTCC